MSQNWWPPCLGQTKKKRLEKYSAILYKSLLRKKKNEQKKGGGGGKIKNAKSVIIEPHMQNISLVNLTLPDSNVLFVHEVGKQS